MYLRCLILLYLFNTFSGFQLSDSTRFFHVEGIEPYVHYSEYHDRIFFVQRKGNHSYLKSTDKESRVQSHGIVRTHGQNDISLNNYHISIGETQALIKAESALRPESNKLVFISLEDFYDQNDHNERFFQAPFIRNGLYHLVNDSLLYTIQRADSIYMSRTMLFEGDLSQMIESYPSFSHNENPAWANSVENQLLKYKMKAVSDSDGNTCAVFRFSSWLLCSRKDGQELFATDQPDQVQFPNVEPTRIRGTNFQTSPTSSEHRVQSIDIAMDDVFVYLLVFGKDIDTKSLILNAFRSRQQVDSEKITSISERVYLFEKETGRFLKEITLPNLASAITVDGNHLIVVEDNEEKGIRWYPKSDWDL